MESQQTTFQNQRTALYDVEVQLSNKKKTGREIDSINSQPSGKAIVSRARTKSHSVKKKKKWPFSTVIVAKLTHLIIIH